MNCQNPRCNLPLKGQRRKWCSEKCRNYFHYYKRRGAPIVYERTCRYCPETFIAVKPNQRICSARCRVTAARIGRESFQKRMMELNRYKIEMVV